MSFSLVTMMLAVGVLVDVIKLRTFPSIFSLLRVFIMNECWILSHAFSASFDIVIFHFSLWMCQG